MVKAFGEKYELDLMPIAIAGKRLELYGVSNWDVFVERLARDRLKNPVSEKASVFDLLGPPHHLFGFSKKSLDILGRSAGFSRMSIMFFEQVLTGDRLRDRLDRLLYLAARSLGPAFYHDLVVKLDR